MALAPGVRLGPYEVSAQIGVGGMGEVYRATDTNLKRAVAIKVLPQALASDVERLARFQREAEVLAALNHPNIAHIHGLERADAMSALVMELVEGPTLADRIAQGPIPLDEALPIARQIAEAIEAAHEQGIIHRDLKPANIKVREDGVVKVLDFGLAKLTQTGGSGPWSPGELSQSPTITSPALMTGLGVILGTAAYMAPEQAKGRDADKRSDIWAFGCVLFEMLSRTRAFHGEDVSDTLAAVLRGEPDWNRLPGGTPAAIRRVLRRCLQKDRSRRLQSAGDARIEIEEALNEPAPDETSAPTSRSSRAVFVWAALALLFFAVALTVTMRHVLEAQPEAVRVRLDMSVPEGVTMVGRPMLSPDGRHVAFIGFQHSLWQIWLRPLDSGKAQAVSGTDGVEQTITWSPDSRSIAFVSESRLRRVSISGGPSQVVSDLSAAAGGALAINGTWSTSDVILVSGGTAGLRRVPAGGGQLSPASQTTPPESPHRLPNFLPDGRHYTFVTGTSPTTQAFIGVLDSDERRPLPGISSESRYSPTGHLVFIRNGALMAQRFDPDSLILSGEAVPIVDQLTADAGAITGQYSVSSTGALAYRLGGGVRNSRFAWFDRSGKTLGPAGAPGEYVQPDLSPDGRFVAFQRGNPPDIWVLDLDRDVATLVTSSPYRDTSPVWSPDGKSIAFDSTRLGARSLYERAFGVVGEDKLLLKTAQLVRNLSDWSRDGRFLAYESGSDVWALPLPISGAAQPLRVTDTPFTESSPRISPDGRWIAYESNESRGQVDIFIQSFPQPGAKLRVSTNGGTQAYWRRDGRELYYMAPGFMLMAVVLKPSGDSVDPGAPSPLFQARLSVGTRRDYWVSADGRFLLNVPAGEQVTPAVTVILNWASTLGK